MPSSKHSTKFYNAECLNAKEGRPIVNFVNRRQLVSEWGHCDPSSLVYVNRYFEFADWSTALLFEAALGIRIPEIKKKFQAEMPLVDASGQFTKSLTMSDVVDIDSHIQSFTRSSFVVVHQ